MSCVSGSVVTGQTSSRSSTVIQSRSRSSLANASSSASAAGSPQRSRRRSTASHGAGWPGSPSEAQ